MLHYTFSSRYLHCRLLLLGLFGLWTPMQNASAHSGALQEVVVIGRQEEKSRIVAGSGNVNAATLGSLALERSGDLLELIPGMVATQHSGSGKANQYFLRGFNLDHGTDFATRVDFMPVNMVSHGHGQGYTDLNFVIPELIHSIQYRKGPYYSDMGDFSGVGEAHLNSAAFLAENKISVNLGQYGYQRLLAISQIPTGEGQWLAAAEAQNYDGPWDNTQEDVNKKNLWLKYATGNASQGLQLSFMAYHNRWNAADQIPLRAINDGRVSRYSTIDPSSGGQSQRYSLSVQKRSHDESGSWFSSAYLIRYGMDLWSNFTYYTQPEGDQIYQQDQRWLAGGEIAHTFDYTLGNFPASHTVGWQGRYDSIDPVGLDHSQQRTRVNVVRRDQVQQWNNGLYWKTALRWHPNWTSVANLRWNYHHFDVDTLEAQSEASLLANQGSKTASLWAGGLRTQYSPKAQWSVYWNIGRGYHSNDARGVLAQLDPVTGAPISAAEALVPVDSTELGADWQSEDGFWGSSVALWTTHIDSELLFVGDAGSTEDTGAASQRYGIEWTLNLQPSESLSLQADYAYTTAKLLDTPTNEQDIAGALRSVIKLFGQWNIAQNWSTALEWRYIGPYPLGENVMASRSQKADWYLDYTPSEHWQWRASVFNIFDRKGYDVEYWYESQLLDESEPQADRHVHSFVPRALRVELTYAF